MAVRERTATRGPSEGERHSRASQDPVEDCVPSHNTPQKTRPLPPCGAHQERLPDRLLTGKPNRLVEAMGAGERPWARRPAEQPLLPAVPHTADQDGTRPQEPRPGNPTWRRHWQPCTGLRCAPRTR